MCRPRESYTTCNYFRGAVNQAGADVIFLGTALSALLMNINGTGFAATGQIPTAGIKVAAMSSGASTIVDFDGVQTTSVAATALALGYIAFGNALITSPQQYNFHGDYFFQALYPSAFTAPQLLTLRTTLLNAFVKPAKYLQYRMGWQQPSS